MALLRREGQDLLPKGSDALNDEQNPSEEIEVLAGIADTFKLDENKAPAVNEQVAKIVGGLMREKLSEDVLTDTRDLKNSITLSGTNLNQRHDQLILNYSEFKRTSSKVLFLWFLSSRS